MMYHATRDPGLEAIRLGSLEAYSSNLKIIHLHLFEPQMPVLVKRESTKQGQPGLLASWIPSFPAGITRLIVYIPINLE